MGAASRPDPIAKAPDALPKSEDKLLAGAASNDNAGAPETGDKGASDADASDAERPTRKGFRLEVERLACAHVNSHFWMSGPEIKQRAATPELVHSAARHGAITRARRWSWYFLYRHPFSKGISTPSIGALYGRDHTTVLYGLGQVEYILKSRPEGVEAKLLRKIARALAPRYGAFLTEGR